MEFQLEAQLTKHQLTSPKFYKKKAMRIIEGRLWNAPVADVYQKYGIYGEQSFPVRSCYESTLQQSTTFSILQYFFLLFSSI